MRVQLVDPSAFTPPYDRALAAALARAGAEVELADEPLPLRAGAAGRGLPGRGALLPAQRRARPRRARPASPSRRAEHLPDMLRFRRARRRRRRPLPVADPARRSTRCLLPPLRPRVMTAHYVLPPRAEPPPGRRRPPRLRPHGRGRRPLRARRRAGCATRSASTPAGSASSRTAPSTT